MRVNSTIETTLQDEDLHEIARINPPAGVELLGVSIRVADGSADLDQFELHGKIGDAQFNFADAQGDFTSPQWPIRRASGDLTALGAGEAGYFVLDVRGLSEIVLYAASAAFDTAGGTLTASGNVSNGDTVQIGDVVYTFVDALSDPAVPYEVLVGEDASGSLDNLIAAINGAAGEGTAYGTGTEAHPQVTASAGDGDTMDVTPDNGAGSYANSIATLTDAANLSWGDDTLTGGAGPTLVTVNFYA